MARVDSNGVAANHQEFDAFGNLLAESDPAYGDRYKFAGQDSMRIRACTTTALASMIRASAPSWEFPEYRSGREEDCRPGVALQKQLAVF